MILKVVKKKDIKSIVSNTSAQILTEMLTIRHLTKMTKVSLGVITKIPHDLLITHVGVHI